MVPLAHAAVITLVSLGDTSKDRVRTVIDPLQNDLPILKIGVGPSS